MKIFLKIYAKYLVWGSLLGAGVVLFFTAIGDKVNIWALLILTFLQGILPALVEILERKQE